MSLSGQWDISLESNMKFSDLSPRIREESLLVLREGGIDAPTEDDFLNAAKEVLLRKGVPPVNLADALILVIGVSCRSGVIQFKDEPDQTFRERLRKLYFEGMSDELLSEVLGTMGRFILPEENPEDKLLMDAAKREKLLRAARKVVGGDLEI